jgi:FkbM family methyltransferase
VLSFLPPVLPFLRTLAETATRGIVFRRRLPPEFGSRRIYVSTEGGLRYLRRDMWKIDPVLLQAATLLTSSDVVWDIGANVGLFTFACAHRARFILAVEPDPLLVSLLEKSRDGSQQITILQAAVVDKEGQATLHIARRLRSANYLDTFGTLMASGSRETIQVRTVTLDSLLAKAPAPTLVKIDIEGAEAKALLGAQRLLSEVRPKFLIEVGAENSAEVTSILHHHRYSLFDGDKANAPVDAAPYSTVAIPD